MNQGFCYREQLGTKARGHRTLSYLVAEYRHSDEAQWRGRLAQHEVLLDGVPAHGDELLKPGSELVWNRPPWEEREVPLHFDVLFEDEALLAVDKPSGLPTLPGGNFLEHTLLHQIRKRWPEASPLHRLGRGTSGLVLFARTQASARALSEAWRQHRVHKRYVAIAAGRAAQERYEIEAPIGLVPHPRLGSVFAVNAEGKSARSVATVLARGADRTLFQVDIETGRPDQIRIHLASVGHPLLGDPLYGVGGLPMGDNPALPGEGGYWLRSERLSFIHPLTGESMELTAPRPAAFAVADGVLDAP